MFIMLRIVIESYIKYNLNFVPFYPVSTSLLKGYQFSSMVIKRKAVT